MSVTEAELIAGEAYQIIGSLSHYANMFDHPEVQRALDWFSGFEPGITYKDDASILPWPKEELKADPNIPRASSVPEAEAVAWQWATSDDKAKGWTIDTDSLWAIGKKVETKTGGYVQLEEIEAIILLTQSAPPVAAPSGEKRYRHKKRGSTYTIVGTAEVQAADDPLTDFELAVVYRGEKDGRLWVRRKSEFEDGRFEKLPPDEGEVGSGWEILATLAPPSPIASEPKDSGSGEGQEMPENEQSWALADAIQDCTYNAAYLPVLDWVKTLNAAGYRITRTAPSGAKP